MPLLLALLSLLALAQSQRTFTAPFHTVNGMILLDAAPNGKSAELLLAPALAVAIWLLCGIARVVRSEEFRRDMERLPEERRRKRGKFLSLLLVP